ncbi:MAG: sigma-70 family RNA polymerase sigma factor [Chloroflexi bacterium]|nr:sigma-70 family RNA polymerase sigma factor [Chloroflexota bacterium]
MNETDLISSAQNGQVRAFNELVRTYQSLVYNVAYRILGEGEAAADVTQEAFFSAYRAIGDFRGGSFKAWLLRIVTNSAYDHLRRKKRRPQTSLEELLEEEGEAHEILPDPGVGPEAQAMQKELGRIIQRGIDALPEEQKIMVILSDVQGLSYEEIADITGTNLGTVKSRLSRARGRLREYLTSQQELLPAQYRLKKNQIEGRV